MHCKNTEAGQGDEGEDDQRREAMSGRKSGERFKFLGSIDLCC